MNINQQKRDQSPYQKHYYQPEPQSNSFNYKSNVPSSRRSSQTNNLQKGLPQRQQWSLIYKQAEEEQRMMQKMEKNYIKNKQREMRQALDRQIMEKNSYRNQKIYDQQYKQWTLERINKQEQKERLEAQKRRIKRKQMQDINFYNLSLKNQNNCEQNSPLEKSLGHNIQQNRQFYQGSSRKRSQDLRQSREITNNSAIYATDKQKRNYQNVYDMYSELVKQQRSKIKEQQQKILKDSQKIRQDGLIKQQQKRIAKQQGRRRVKEVLDHQVQIHHLHSENEKRINPQEDVSYKLFSNLNRESLKKRAPSDHVEFLRKQMEEERQRKAKSRYMTQQEYRLNMNQLNKAVNGKYAHDGYQDRSVNSIGQRLRKFAKAGNQMSRIIGMEYQSSNDNPQNSNGSDAKFEVDSQLVRRKLDQMNYRRRNSGEISHQDNKRHSSLQNNIF